MSGQDFIRHFNDTSGGFRKPQKAWLIRHIDFPLLLALLLLFGFGLLILYSASGESYSVIKKQSLFFAIGLVLMVAAAQVPMHYFQRWAPWLFGIGLAALGAVLLFGVGAKGAQRWLNLGLIRIQPSELMKLLVPLIIAWYFSARPLPPSFKHIFWGMIMIGIPAFLIAVQPDLGTAILVSVSGIFVFLLAGISWRIVLSGLGVAILSVPAFWFFMLHEYQKKRILIFLNPESEPLGAGWNIIQSKTAIGAGGIYGKGWGYGVQSQLDFLPESHTDFIVAVLAEEFGLIGVLFLLAIYIVIIARGLYIAFAAQDMFNRLLAGSITLTFFVYIFVNMGMVAGLLPVVGVPLPLVSQGGTSIVALLIGFGILMSIHTHSSLLRR